MILPQKITHCRQGNFFFPQIPAHMQANPIYWPPFPLQRRSSIWRNIAPARQNSFSPALTNESKASQTESGTSYGEGHEAPAHEPAVFSVPSLAEHMAPIPNEIFHVMEEVGSANATDEKQEEAEGLSRFKKWWYLRHVDISVNGNLLSGFPIFVFDNTLRVMNEKYSYFIPMRNVEYIRTPDGFNAMQEHFNGCLHE